MVCENAINRLEYGGDRAKRQGERNVLPCHASGLGTLAKEISHTREFFRPGALKAVNGLFLVADGKQCALRWWLIARCSIRLNLARARSGKELTCQSFNDPPLFGAGVLAFVDEDVI